MRLPLFAAASLFALIGACASEPGASAQNSTKASPAAIKAANDQAAAGEPDFRALYKELIETNTSLSA